MSRLFVIAGPTASGKTAVAVALAKLIGGEVVSADSMQIYEGMDIGTAKPTLEERDGVPHHMIDIAKPDEQYSAALYQQHARAAIADVQARGRVPILCGGTGFYINAVINDVQFAQDNADAPTAESAIREYFMHLAAEHGCDKLHMLLQEADPAAAAAIHPNNIKRVSRALSYIEATGLLFSDYNGLQREQPPAYDAVFCRLCVDRPVLYRRINERAQAMFDAGLEEEVAGLLARGCHPGLTSMQGIGYKEVVRFVNGEIMREETIEAVKQNSRRYAKRQETWFRNQNPNAVAVPAEGPAEDIALDIALHFPVNAV